MGKKLYVHDGSAGGAHGGFKLVASTGTVGPELKINDGSSTAAAGFKKVLKGYVNDGSSTSYTGFKEFYVGSHPVTYTFLANTSASFREVGNGNSPGWNTAGSAATVKAGAFTTGFSPFVGVFGFSTMQGGGLTLAQALAERPFVTNAATTLGAAENYIALRRKLYSDSVSGAAATYGTWYLAAYNGNANDSTSDADKCDFSTNVSFTRASNNELDYGDTMTFDLNGSSSNRTKMQTFVDHAATQGLLLTTANSISGVKSTSGTRPETEYSFFYGTGETTPPKLVVTLDYVAA